MNGDPVSRLERNEVDFFDKVYGDQAFNPTGNRIKSRRELRQVLRLQGANGLGRVLSIGCGEGEFERMIAPHAQKVTALDISPAAIELAERLTREQRIENVDFQCLSVDDLSWDERFDTIVCLAFLHHVPENEVPALLERVHAHLEPGGLFYSQDPNAGGILRSIGRVVLGDRYDAYHSEDERELDPEELRRTLLDAGFAEAEIIPIDVTVIPAMYMLARQPGWILHVCAFVDRVFCASPFRRWASGFAAAARRGPA